MLRLLFMFLVVVTFMFRDVFDACPMCLCGFFDVFLANVGKSWAIFCASL